MTLQLTVSLNIEFSQFQFLSHANALRFDKASKYAEPVLSELPAPADHGVEMMNWEGEPTTLESLLDTYNLETKSLSRWGGVTLFLVASRSRSGKLENVVSGQMYKLFMVFWLH